MASLGVGAARILRIVAPAVTRCGPNGLTKNVVCSPHKYFSMSAKALAEMKYTEKHEWVRVEGNVGTIGITARACEGMGQLVFLEMSEEGTEVDQGDECGTVESVKAVAEVYAPVSGKIVERNARSADAPEKVNSDPYGDDGWLFKIELSKPAELEALLTEEQYKKYLEEME